MSKEELLHLVTKHLEGIENFTHKNMFGGIGLFIDKLMFGKIGKDKVYLKVDDTNKDDFIAYGMQPFYSEKKKKGMPYWEVPNEVLQNNDLFLKWAQKSFEIAKNNKK